MITFDMTDGSSRVHFADSLSLSEVPYLHLVSSTKQHVEPFVKVQTIDKAVSVERGQELAFLQRNSVHLVGRRTHTKIGINWVENHVSGEVWYSGFVMCTVLGVELNTAVDLGHGDLAIVVSENIELDYFAVEAP